jgi:hypothetical protein
MRDTRTGEESLYELDADPRETNDVLRTAPPEIASTLRAALDENFATTSAPAADGRPLTAAR